MSIQEFWELYLALGVTASKVIQLLDEPLCLTSNQSRVFGYLVQMIGNMKQDELRSFLRFVSGSSVCLSGRLAVRFNSLSGLGRRPIAHTCDCVLELPVSYTTYLEFVGEFRNVLTSDECWIMNAI